MYTLKKINYRSRIKLSIVLILTLYLTSCVEENFEENLITENQTKKSKLHLASRTVAPIVNESDYYKDSSYVAGKYTAYKNFVTDFNGHPEDFDTDDSQNLQNAIDSISNVYGGGRLVIPAGNYTFEEINLKSNVHLRINSGAIIKPNTDNTTDFVIFKVTNNITSPPLENVSIIGVGGKFTVDLEELQGNHGSGSNNKQRVIESKNVKNFKYSNMLVKDNKSKYAAIEFNGVDINGNINGPRFGVVSNIDVTGAHYGFGVVQLQLGREIFFKNLYGEGGITLRIETHNQTLYDPSKFTKSHNLYARNIRSKNGNCAVMLSPHFVEMGKVDIDDVTAEGSGFGVRVERGFFTCQEQSETGITLENGSFGSQSVISNVTVTYGNNTAQIKPKHIKYIADSLLLPDPLYEQFPTNTFPYGTFDSYIYINEASIAGALDTSNYTINFSESDVNVTNPDARTKFEDGDTGNHDTPDCN